VTTAHPSSREPTTHRLYIFFSPFWYQPMIRSAPIPGVVDHSASTDDHHALFGPVSNPPVRHIDL
jgi:hypothetical protein